MDDSRNSEVLALRIRKWRGPFPGGQIFVYYSDAPPEITKVLKDTLGRKLQKLADAPATCRILLLETNVAWTELADALEAVMDESPIGWKTNAIWSADTAAWETERVAFFVSVWPPGSSSPFQVPDDTMAG